jgi:hypothetical protein
MVIEILQRRTPKEQRDMLRSYGGFDYEDYNPDNSADDDDGAAVEALKLGKDGLDIVRYVLSKSVPLSSIFTGDGFPIVVAIHYVDPLGNIMEAPLDVIEQIIKDYKTNYDNDEPINLFHYKSEISNGLRVSVLGLSPLLACCYRTRDSVKCAKLILDAGADPNEIHADTGNTTALILACRSNNVSLAKFLLDRGADPNMAGKRFKKAPDLSVYLTDTPLLVAIREGMNGKDYEYKEIINLLLSKGANPNKKIRVKNGPEVSEEDLLLVVISNLIDSNISTDRNKYNIYQEKRKNMLKFLIMEKGFRCKDETFVSELLQLLTNNSDIEDDTSEIITKDQDLFFKSMEGITDREEFLIIMRETLSKIFQYEFDAYTQAQIKFLFKIDALRKEEEEDGDFLDLSIFENDLLKVKFFLSFKHDLKAVRKRSDDLPGTLLDYARRKLKNFGKEDVYGIRLDTQEHLKDLFQIIKMLEDAEKLQ